MEFHLASRRGFWALPALSLTFVSLCETPSLGGVVTYDNSAGTFFWQLSIRDVDGTPYPGTFLDITQPPTQSGEQRPGSLGKWYSPNQASDEPALRYLEGQTGLQTARTTDLVVLDWNNTHGATRPTRNYEPGERVTESDNWNTASIYFVHLPFSYSLEEGTPLIGDPSYLGVRVKMADNQWHYGWIYFTDYAWPTMWAYETEANVPIQIPVPGPGAGVFALVGGVGVGFRRNRG